MAAAVMVTGLKLFLILRVQKKAGGSEERLLELQRASLTNTDQLQATQGWASCLILLPRAPSEGRRE